MAIFVNYYPCSYGDSFVAMFANQQIWRQDNIVHTLVNDFKQLEFYQLDATAQRQRLDKLDDTVYSCHRQNSFDFNPHKVISIVVDIDKFLVTRFKKIHIDQLRRTFANDAVRKLENKFTVEQLFHLDYSLWKKNNIFSTDIELPLSLVYNKAEMKKFCVDHNLNFDEARIDDIANDIKRYL